MFQILHTGFRISSFFHEHNTEVVWALGSKRDQSGLTAALLFSDDYFATFSVFKIWQPGEINFAGGEMYATVYIDRFGNKYVSNNPVPLICRPGETTWKPVWQGNVGFMSPATALLVPGWSIAENNDRTIVFAEYGGYDGSPRRPTAVSSRARTRAAWLGR
jgi:hypothetical protein